MQVSKLSPWSRWRAISGFYPISTDSPEALIVSSAIFGGLSRLLAEKLLLLEGKDLDNGGSIEVRNSQKSKTDT